MSVQEGFANAVAVASAAAVVIAVTVTLLVWAARPVQNCQTAAAKAARETIELIKS
jgi:hypothetical protein